MADSQIQMAGDDRDTRAKTIQKKISTAQENGSHWRHEAHTDYAFYAGDQWDETDRELLEQQGKPVMTFNRVTPMVDAVAGQEINNRHEIRYRPRENNDAGVAEIYTAGVQYQRELCDAEDEESEAFLDACISGLGWTETLIDYEGDEPDGAMCVSRIDPLEMVWDWRAKKANLIDRKWDARIRKMRRSEAEDFVGKTLEQFGVGTDFDDHQGGPVQHETPRSMDYRDETDPDIDEFDADDPLIELIDYHECITETYYRVAVPGTNKIENVSEKAFRKIKKALDEARVPSVRQKKRVYRRTILIGDNVVWHGDLPIQSGFVRQAITGKRDRNRNEWFGLVRQMRDPQLWGNKWLSQSLHILNTNAKGGVLYETNAVLDVEEFEENFAASDTAIEVADGALSGKKIEGKPVTGYPQGFQQMMEMAFNALPYTTGINLESMGLANRDQAGVLEYQRRQSAMTILATLFNSLRRYRKKQGRIMLEFVTKFLADGRMVRIVGQEGEKFVEMMAKPGENPRYDIVIDDSPTSPNQREATWQVISSILPMLLKSGLPIPPDLLDFVPIPATLAEKWKSMLQQQSKQQGGPPPDPAKQAQAQATMQKAQMEGQRRQQMMPFEIAEAKADAARAMAEAKQAEADAKRAQAEAARAQAEAMAARTEAQIVPLRAAHEMQDRDRRTDAATRPKPQARR